MIRVAFRHNDPRLFARLVCWVRGGDTAHCEAAYDWGSDWHRCVSSSFVDGGVRGKLIELTADKWRIYEVPGDPNYVQAWLLQHDDERYGTFKLIRFLLGLRINWGGPICSGAVAEMMRLPHPYLYDPRTLEAVCAYVGKRVQ